MNVRGWGNGKLEDISCEMNEWDVDVVGVTETQLRERLEKESDEYFMLNKGRSKWKKSGGGVGMMIRKKSNIVCEEINVGTDEMSEDILAMKLEYKVRNVVERVVMVVCYMTVQGMNAARDNERKYEILRNLVRENVNEKIVIMGDMNGHIGILSEDVNGNGQKLLDFAEQMRMEILNVTIAEGKTTWSVRDQVSAIDYILVNENAREKVQNMWIDESGMIDVATDHNVLVLNWIGAKSEKKSERRIKQKRWKMRDVKWDDFQVELSEIDFVCGGTVENANSELREKITKAAEKRIGYIKESKKKKRKNTWWNAEIQCARKERKEKNKRCRSLRKQRGRGENEENEYQVAWEEYKNRQRVVKVLIRKAREKEEKIMVEKIRESEDGEGRDWYKFLKGERVNGENVVEEISVNGECIRDEERMKDEVRIFWEDIGGMNEESEDEEINLNIESKVFDNMDSEISMNEVRKYVSKLKNKKAAGLDGIPYEMYKWGGEWMIRGLYKLFKKVWIEERVPSKWNESRVILLHKGGHKSKKELKNYRPIALADTVGKIFCGILNERMKEAVESMKVMGEEQNGFRVDRRGEDNMYVVKEMIEMMKRENKCGYMAFLDIEKAYDRVNRNVMLRVLKKIGVCEKIIKIIGSMYVNTRAKYMFGEIETEWVRSKRGVRQGCVLSPLLFGLYTEELAVRVRESGKGMQVGNERLSILLYADDVVIMSEDRRELQEILDVVTSYGNDFRVKFSAEKSQVIVVNGNEEDDGYMWQLGGMNIGRTNEYKYLGMKVDECGCEKTKNEKMYKAQQWYGRLGSAIKFRANKYEVVRGIWKSMSVPSLMYGMEVMAWSVNELSKLENVQSKIGRMGLGANGYVGIEAVRGEMGWSTFAERFMKAVMLYKVRLERMDEERWARKVYKMNHGRSKWEKMCVRYVNKCDFNRMFTVRIDETQRPEWRMLSENGVGNEWSMQKWKIVVDGRVKEMGLRKWKNGINEKVTLAWYRYKEKPKRECMYDGSYGSELLFKARTMSLEVNARTYRWSESGIKTCEQCTSGEDETVKHVIVKCSKYEMERNVFINEIVREIGMNEWLNKRDNEDEALLYVLGMQEEINMSVIEKVKEFLEKMWRKRSE